MHESAVTREIKKAMIQQYNSDAWLFKTVGSGFMNPGIPDLIGCLFKRFVAIEVKLIKTLPKKPDAKLFSKCPFTKDQLLHLEQIQKAGGCALGLLVIPQMKWHGVFCAVQNLSYLSSLSFREMQFLKETYPENWIQRKFGKWLLSNLKQRIKNNSIPINQLL